MKNKILIVDDHLLVREGLKLIIETDDAYQVIAEAEDGNEALKILTHTKPDIILLDLNMPVMNGLQFMQHIQANGVNIPIIILTTYNESDYMLQGLALGAKGYLLKDTNRDALFHTLESALRGETLLQPEVAEKMFAAKQSMQQLDKNQKKTAVVLSGREQLVLQAAARGFRTKEIAFDLGVSERTVKAHLTNIYNKLAVDSRSQAVAFAIEQGLIHL